MGLKHKKLWLCVGVFLAFFILVKTVGAQERKTAADKEEILQQAVEPTGVSQAELPETAGILIELGLGVSGLIFFVLMVYAGVIWLTARGNEEAVNKAKNTLIAAILGLVVTVAAYAITNLLMKSLLEGSVESGPVGSFEGEALGCCFDLVGTEYTHDNPFDSEFGNWTWRITTNADCVARGTDPDDPLDIVYGPGTYEFYPGEDAEECEIRYNQEKAQ